MINEDALVARRLMLQSDRQRRRQLRRRRTIAGRAAFNPTQLSVLSSWLRVANATSDVNGISSVPDLLNTNPAVQSVNARKPVIEASANGLPCMRFATNNVLAWPITAQSSPDGSSGWGLWVKLDAVGVATNTFMVAAMTPASADKIYVDYSVTSGGTYRGVYYTPAATFQRGPAGAVDTSWHFLTIEFDPTGANAAAQRVLTLDGVSVGVTVTGSGATLNSATGTILIGNRADGETPSLPLNGLLGPNIYAFASKMPGAEFGLLTTAARLALMNFEAPT